MRLREGIGIASFVALFAAAAIAQTGTVRVRVQDAKTSAPLSDVTLLLALADPSEAPQLESDYDLQGFLAFVANTAPHPTDAGGTAVYNNVRPGRYVVSAKRDGYYGIDRNGKTIPAATSSTIDIGPGQWTADLSLSLNPAPYISGLVRSAAGNVVPNACVDLGTLQVQNGQTVFASETTTFTDAEGAYRVRTAGPGYYLVRVRAAVAQPVLYYPGNPDVENAAFVSVGENSDSSRIDIFMPPAASAIPLPGISELIRQSDFIGFVLGTPRVSSPSNEWRQSILAREVDSLKGILLPDSASQSPPIYGDYIAVAGYPTRFTDLGTYLVFLRRETRDARNTWTANAVFRVEYRPDETGQILGKLFGGSGGEEVNVLHVRDALDRALRSNASAADLEFLDTYFSRAAASQCKQNSNPNRVSAEERLREVESLASRIRLGTTRNDIEKVFPEMNGGICAIGGGCYYVDPGVRVDVSYDDTGGSGSSANRVNRPIRVYRGSRLAD